MVLVAKKNAFLPFSVPVKPPPISSTFSILLCDSMSDLRTVFKKLYFVAYHNLLQRLIFSYNTDNSGCSVSPERMNILTKCSC